MGVIHSHKALENSWQCTVCGCHVDNKISQSEHKVHCARIAERIANETKEMKL